MSERSSSSGGIQFREVLENDNAVMCFTICFVIAAFLSCVAFIGHCRYDAELQRLRLAVEQYQAEVR